MQNLKLNLVLIALTAGVILFSIDASYGQSYTKTTYENVNAGITTVTKVSDRISPRVIYSDNYETTVFRVNTQAAYNAGYNSVRNNYSSLSGSDITKPITVKFSSITTEKLATEADTTVEIWSTHNTCTYKVNRKKSQITFVEKTPGGELVKSWSRSVQSHFDDEEVNGFVCDGLNILIWKDLSMVVMIQADYTYIVSAYYYKPAK
jgi:hypothetical protein